MLRDNLPAPADDALLMICGPDGLINHTVKPALVSQKGGTRDIAINLQCDVCDRSPSDGILKSN